MLIWSGKKKVPKWLKMWIWEVLGLNLEGFGTLWAVLWPLLGSFWPFLGGSKSHLFKALVHDGLPKAF